MPLTTEEATATAAAELSERSVGRLDRVRELVARIEAARAPFTRTNVLAPLNAIAVELSNVGAECSLLSEVHPDHAARETAEEMVREGSKLDTELDQDRRIYDALGALDEKVLDPLERRVVSLVRRDMRRAGVELGAGERERVRGLREELVAIGQEFSRNLRDDVRSVELAPEELAGLPDDYVRAHPAGSDGKVRITTDYPDYIPFMAYARSGRARQALMRAANTRAVPANLAALDKMLSKRQELANLLGYPNWAEYATEVLMMGSRANAWRFVDEAYAATAEAAKDERARLLAMKRRDGLPGDVIYDFEHAYLTDRVKESELAFDARAVRPYFEYRTVTRAILDLSSELFGMTFTKVDEPLWHPSVETFDVTVDGQKAGRISLDMFPREGKFKHAACFSLRPGVGGVQLPHYVLVCNFPDPDAQSGPALMEHREVVTFFHEFGHLVHSIVRGPIPWVRLGQVAEWDFVEAPSQFLEEWIYDFDVLRRFAKHVETGEPISEELVRRLREARDFGRGMFVQRQLFLSAIALAYHDRDPKTLDTTKTLFELAGKYSPSTIDPESRFQASFGHLEGYTAAYATYMWSLAISKQFFSAFRGGLMDIARIRRYRDTVLAAGGTKSAADLVQDFLGRPFSVDAFREWLSPKT